MPASDDMPSLPPIIQPIGAALPPLISPGGVPGQPPDVFGNNVPVSAISDATTGQAAPAAAFVGSSDPSAPTGQIPPALGAEGGPLDLGSVGAGLPDWQTPAPPAAYAPQPVIPGSGIGFIDQPPAFVMPVNPG